MPYVVGIGHCVPLQELCDRFSFTDFDEAETNLVEAGLDIFINDDDSVFITIADKHRLITDDLYVDLSFSITDQEHELLKTYTGQSDRRIKLFWTEPEEDEAVSLQSAFNQMLAIGESLDVNIGKVIST